MRRVPRILVHCAFCGAAIWKTQARLNSGRGRYCSKECGGSAAVARGQVVYRGRHGWSRTRTHNIWMGMRDRCLNPNNHAFGYYGARGIGICERWSLFENFLADMGECPPKGSLDRIDNNGGYGPDNCRWATQAEQLRNTRRTHIVTYENRQWCVTDLAEHLKLKPETLFSRIRLGWSPDRWATRPKPCGPAYSLRQSKNS